MRDFLNLVAKSLVDNPNQVIINQEDIDNKVVFTLQVAQTDIGKIIGRNGKTAHSLRTLLGAIGAKEGKRAILEIAE